MPDNAIHYQLAYGVTLVLYGGYALTLVMRAQALRRCRERQQSARRARA